MVQVRPIPRIPKDEDAARHPVSPGWHRLSVREGCGNLVEGRRRWVIDERVVAIEVCPVRHSELKNSNFRAVLNGDLEAPRIGGEHPTNGDFFDVHDAPMLRHVGKNVAGQNVWRHRSAMPTARPRSVRIAGTRAKYGLSSCNRGQDSNHNTKDTSYKNVSLDVIGDAIG